MYTGGYRFGEGNLFFMFIAAALLIVTFCSADFHKSLHGKMLPALWKIAVHEISGHDHVRIWEA